MDVGSATARPIRSFQISRRIGEQRECGGKSYWTSKFPREVNFYGFHQRIERFLKPFHGLGEYGFQKESGVDALLTDLARTIDGDHGKLGWAASDEQGDSLDALNRVISASSRLLAIFTPDFIVADKARAQLQLAQISSWHSGRKQTIASDERVSHGFQGGYSARIASMANNDMERVAQGASARAECVRLRMTLLETIVLSLQAIYDEAVASAQLAASPLK
jgi:hypothetical protein